ncbi:S1C family serine protease [Ferdinandcohnia quinoae]|uniref:Trypsin-like peptidase domain-containing protein n=1 Tax=Fredinandcohnia quinoae TaxID=2918902 RepID=A0AAW5EBD4_9BACI|nr:trypsin-like peptidase domain-containing protein [Fredinandcohnia sp. SECRCQ15]MCH1626756.1 trypsin-like peptidase domain-containing protein [Fredinandcohnia sp. SECRCQ15]
MGYYDQDYQNQRYSQKGSRRGWFLSALVGAILGAFLMLIALPFLSKYDLLPFELSLASEEQNGLEDVDIAQPPTKSGAQQNINVNVTTGITKAVDKVSEAVVGIVNLQESNFWSGESQEAGTGSGVLYKKGKDKAFIVTNHHVVEGASNLEVSLSDGSRVKATLLGSDVWTDLAVIEIDAKDVTKVATFGNSDDVNLGEPVIAIGNPLGLEFSGSVTQGIISGLNRTIPIDINEDGVPDWNADVMQTDAAINPGNSGGALVNIKGEVIGINSMKIAQEAVEGIGLSIPITSAKPIIEDLEKFGEVHRPFMGVGQLKAVSEISSYHRQQTLQLPRDVTEGVAVLEVLSNSPAAQAGLRELDVIVELDGEKIDSVIALRKHLYTKKSIGDSMETTIYRSGKKQKITIRLEKESM